jgi:hypothetical protein
MDDELVPPPHIQAYICRLILAADSDDRDAYHIALGEIVRCQDCTSALIGTLVHTMIGLLDNYEPGWLSDMQNHLADLLDSLQ